MAKKKSNRKRTAKRAKPKSAPAEKSAGFLSWLFFWPYHLCRKVSRDWPRILRAPFRLGGFLATMALFGLLLMALIYGSRAMPYDLDEVRQMPERSVVLDRFGNEIARMHGEDRTVIPLSKVAPVFEDALLAREDSRFRSHFGVDPFGLARSLLENIKRGGMAQGGSTITMQLARNTFDLKNKFLAKKGIDSRLVELDRKFLEIAVSFRIESRYSKDEILEAYINRIFWGHSFRGVETASQNYFGKPASHLTLSEAAMLAGIIRGPNAFTPFRYPERAKRERDSTLDSMVRENFISPEEAAKAKEEPLRIQSPKSARIGWSLNIMQAELEEILSKKNIRRGGLKITTTLDSSLQTITAKALEDQLQAIEARPGYSHPTRAQWNRNQQGDPQYLQGAVVLIDTRTGAVRALIGGRDVEDSAYNRAQWSRRSCGSLIKPFVYLAAFEDGLLPESWVRDTPVDGNWPANADGKYYDFVKVGDALIQSRNASTVRVGNYAGLENVAQTARAAGLLQTRTRDQTLFLGNTPASPWQLAAAYTTFPNNGNRVRPYLIEKIEDASQPGSKPLYKTKPIKQIVSPAAPAALVHHLLEDVTRVGTAASLRHTYHFNKPAGGKTGTTNDYRDAWFCGYTSSLTGCVWIGLDKPQTIIPGGYGGSLALPVWASIMNRSSGLRNRDNTPRYPASDLDPGLTYRAARLCRLSGKRATSGCESAGTAYNDLVPDSILPAQNDYCTVHPLQAVPVPKTPQPSREPSAAPNRPLRALPVE